MKVQSRSSASTLLSKIKKMKKYFKEITPSWTAILSFLILPFILTLYFLITKYSDKFISTTEINYFEVQDSILSTFFLQQAWNDYLARIMDFAFWGVLASIAVLIWWGVSVAKTSVENHLTEQSFVNFKVSKEKWHGNFAVVALIKTVLVFVMIYCVFTLIARAIPQLALGIASCVQSVNSQHLFIALLGVLQIIALQFLFVVAFKTFKITRAD